MRIVGWILIVLPSLVILNSLGVVLLPGYSPLEGAIRFDAYWLGGVMFWLIPIGFGLHFVKKARRT